MTSIASEPEPAVHIITTIGPSSWSRDVIAAHLELGVRCIRFPFSKLRPEDHVARCALVREVAGQLGASVLTMADLPGGKPRLHSHGPTAVEPDRPYHIGVGTERDPNCELWVEPVPTRSFQAGDEVVIGDSENRFFVSGVTGRQVTGTFAVTGTIEWQRAFMPLAADIELMTLTPRDKELAAYAHSAAFDWLALSHVHSAEDVNAARAWLADALHWDPYLVAKIETRAAVCNAAAIAHASDAVMVARGDLALQLGLEELWPAQRAVLEVCARAGRYCIVATGLLESLATRDAPSRAECIDLCAALEMGASAVMFSSETSIGARPVQSVATALAIARAWQRARRGTQPLFS